MKRLKPPNKIVISTRTKLRQKLYCVINKSINLRSFNTADRLEITNLPNNKIGAIHHIRSTRYLRKMNMFRDRRFLEYSAGVNKFLHDAWH